MEKINIAKILRNCPKGMELDCAMWNNVRLKCVDIDSTYPIVITHQAGENIYAAEFTEYGCWNQVENAKCVIFPKGKTTWEGFIPPCKFKVGDTLQNKKNGKQITITKIHQDCYECDDRYALTFENQDNWELVPNKFDISTLVPFESRVLVRNCKDQYWIPAYWGHKAKHGYVTTFGYSNYCIPYEGNEHLLMTKDDCSELYKTE